MFLGDSRQVADGRGRRVTGANYEDILAGINRPPLAENVL
jgi:hypothetical protein